MKVVYESNWTLKVNVRLTSVLGGLQDYAEFSQIYQISGIERYKSYIY